MKVRRRFPDLDHARLHLAALKELCLQGTPGDTRALRRVTALCSAAHAVLKDPYCSMKLAALAECATLWYSRRRSTRPELHLEQLLDLLDLLQSRIHAIEAIRRASERSITH
jgi:hypothetical protein